MLGGLHHEYRLELPSPRAMVARLDRRLDLLKTDSCDRPVRHQSLRHAVSWSYDLLTAGEQAMFRRLSVFVGGCSLNDAACCAMRLPTIPVTSLEECAALVDHSLVRREDAADGSPRLTMLETIREFGLERLREAGEATNARRAHAAGFLAFAERAEPALTGPDQAAWFDRLELEHDNLRTALSWAVDVGDVDLALRLGKSLWRFWVARGHLREGRERLARLLAMPGADARTLLRRGSSTVRPRWFTGAQISTARVSWPRRVWPLRASMGIGRSSPFANRHLQ